jgi:hypothetical protein
MANTTLKQEGLEKIQSDFNYLIANIQRDVAIVGRRRAGRFHSNGQ